MKYLVALLFFLVPVGVVLVVGFFGTLVGAFATDGFGLAAGVAGIGTTGVLIVSTF